MLTIHITIAILSALYGTTTLARIFMRKHLQVGRSAFMLALMMIGSVSSGLLLTLETHTAVLSVCDNLALYVTGFAVVYGALAYVYGIKKITPHATYSFAYSLALPIVLLSLGF